MDINAEASKYKEKILLAPLDAKMKQLSGDKQLALCLMSLERLYTTYFVKYDKKGAKNFSKLLSVFDKGIITQHLKNGANLHQTAAIGETQSGGFFCDMAGAHWGPPCFGYQGGPQQTPAILPAKSKLSCGDFETKCPKAIVVPAHFCIGALVVYPPSPPTIEHSREWAVKGA